MKTIWEYNNNDKNVVKNFFKARGFKNQKQIDYFLNFKEEYLREDYKDLDKVVKHLADAIKHKSNIVIYGDYDCDGITATSIILLALRNIGVKANYFINNRFTEGYGMNEKGLKRLLKEYPETDFIITCDNGIAAGETIKTALALGIDVVCTDHHLQKGDIVVPTVDEWRNDEDKAAREECCGAEIARRVMKALYIKLGKDTAYIDKLIVFSGIATVADVVKFTPANHFIVKKCLQMLENPEFPIIALIKSEMKIEEIDEETLGFKIAPLMNCLSRVTGTPDEMVEILTSEKNDMKTFELVENAVATNDLRKDMTTENMEMAKDEIDSTDACIVLAGKYDSGIAGLVASTVVEDYNRPCICLCEEGDVLHGSARSYLDFHLKNALDECADLLLTYGGHAGAAGLSLKKENLEPFRKRICKIVRNSGVLKKDIQIRIDYTCDVSNMFDENVNALRELGPFGEGFEKPRIVYCGYYKNLAFLPKNADVAKHVSFTLDDNVDTIGVMWWNAYEKWKKVSPQASDIVAVMGYPKIETYQGHDRRRLYADDLKIANDKGTFK